MRKLHIIACEISRDWSPINFAAVPYWRAMSEMENIDDAYGADNGKSIVMYFLSNARSWRGETAKRIKAELKGML